MAGQYCEGATTYCVNVPGSYGARSSGASLFQDGGVAAGWWDDAYFADNPAVRGELELPKVWNVQAGFQHYWTNSLRSSIWGSIRATKPAATRLTRSSARPLGFGAGCADWSAWQVGSRTIWNPVTNLDIGLEVMYTKIETAFAGGSTGCGVVVAARRRPLRPAFRSSTTSRTTTYGRASCASSATSGRDRLDHRLTA